MSEGTKEPGVIAFGYFEADLRTQELRRRGVPVRLPAQSFQVLRMLLSRPGELVSRQELKKTLWSDDSFGDFEHGLNAAVNRLRDALGDSAESPQYVETLPRRGYRFVATVLPVANGTSAVPEAVSPPKGEGGIVPVPPGTAEVPPKADTATPRSRKGWAWSAEAWLLLALCIAAALMLLWRHERAVGTARSGAGTNSGRNDAEVQTVPLTSLPGMEYAPTFSPDGSQVAFAWDGGKTDETSPYDLYTKVIGSERVEQLTHKPATWIVPAWSPDGRTIAFARSGPGNAGIFMVSALGGPERKLADVRVKYDRPISLSWSPDGRALLYVTQEGMRSVQIEDGSVRPIAAGAACDGTFTPTFSPDGRWIAFSCLQDETYDLLVMPAKGGSPKKSVRVNDIPMPLAWSTDSERILYTENNQLFEVSKDGGPAHLLSFAHNAQQPAVSLRGERLAYAEGTSNVNLWRMDLGSSPGGATSLLSATSREERAPDISPDGRRIAFESERSGGHEVWLSNLDGSDAVQLSHFRSLTGTPRWSPDGKWIVFDSRETGKASLYLVDPETGVPRRIDVGDLLAEVPSWSRDGRWIYFHGGSDEGGAIYKVALQGGAPQLVRSTSGGNAQEAKSGRMLYFTSGMEDGEIHALDLDSGEERALRGMPRILTPTDWVVGSKGIYFVSTAMKRSSIDFYDFASAQVTRRFPLQKPSEYWGGLALSRDERWLAYAQVDRNESDLMLAEHFR